MNEKKCIIEAFVKKKAAKSIKIDKKVKYGAQ